MFTKSNFKQRISILQNGASGEKVSDTKFFFVKNVFKYNYIILNWWIFGKNINITSSLWCIQGIWKKIQAQNI